MATNRALSQEDGNLNQVPIISSRTAAYSDIDLLFANRPSGDVYKKVDAAAVRQSIKTILLTNHFEKPFLPLFGADLQQLLFDLNDPIVAPTAEREILENLAIYEPRAKPLSVKVSPQRDTNEVVVEVVFQIRSTNEQDSITTKVARLR
jgi:phage baseplate assembly protein W